jgi:hypothetical protein
MMVRAVHATRNVTVLAIAFATTAAYVGIVTWAMDRADYDLWMALLLGPLLVAITLPALRRQAEREEDSRLFLLLVFALLLKLFASLARMSGGFGLYGGAPDAAVYHGWGVDISERFRSLVFETGLPDLHGTRFIRFFTGVVYTIVGPTKIGGFLIFSWLGFLGLFLLYRAFTIAVPGGRPRTYGRFVFFHPSMLFWPSSIGNEAGMVIGNGFA